MAKKIKKNKGAKKRYLDNKLFEFLDLINQLDDKPEAATFASSLQTINKVR